VDIVSSYVKDTVVLILDLIFTERIVNRWNTLPPEIVNFNSMSGLKRFIKLITLRLLPLTRIAYAPAATGSLPPDCNKS